MADIRRAILDPATGLKLGFVGSRPPSCAGWKRWLAGTVLEVYETEDASLVFTVGRRWFLSPWWEVYDSEQHLVGSFRFGTFPLARTIAQRLQLRDERGLWRRRISGHLVRGRYGQLLALIEYRPSPAQGVMVGPDGVELGRWRRCAEGTLVRFATSLAGDPFAKMALLAAVLSRE
jgi:hypothetical protein